MQVPVPSNSVLQYRQIISFLLSFPYYLQGSEQSYHDLKKKRKKEPTFDSSLFLTTYYFLFVLLVLLDVSDLFPITRPTVFLPTTHAALFTTPATFFTTPNPIICITTFLFIIFTFFQGRVSLSIITMTKRNIYL